MVSGGGAVKRANAIRASAGERAFDRANAAFMAFLIGICLYPFWYIIVCSVSDGNLVQSGAVFLWPREMQLNAYAMLFKYENIARAYYNTLWYVSVGTALTLVMTYMAAYVLARRSFSGNRFFMLMFTFTMFFGGGMIPTFLWIRQLGLLNTRWSIVLPGAVSAYNMIVMRTFIQNDIPDSVIESAWIDGANDVVIMARIVMPLCKPVIAVMLLFYGVGHWNAYFGAMIYLNDKALQPIQLLLRTIVIQNSVNALMGDVNAMEDKAVIGLTIQYAAIVVATLPILCAYPFLQKYFVKGVMIGAIKG
ncbi:MAG: carbohydrate ABC transporter permease [Clostridiales bacterium]|nr:carbohydrate ABC transporter permease [Clostridiales bacterium]